MNQIKIKELYDLGFGIHWLAHKSKVPVKGGWTNGKRDDWKTLVSEHSKDYNVGTKLGKASAINGGFLAVIDCDMKSTEPHHLKEMQAAIESISEKIDLDSTPMVLSGRGGGSCHYYILTDQPIKMRKLYQSQDRIKVLMPSAKPSNNEIETLSADEIKAGMRLRAAWEIGLIGEGQQVVLPPSIHPDSGKPYVWNQGFEFGIVKVANSIFDSIGEKIRENKSKTNLKNKTVDQDFKFIDVKLNETGLSAKIISLIVDGTDCVDRSAGLMSAAIAMARVGMDDQEIVSVLTDDKNFLGQVAFDHVKSDSRKKAAEWLLKYTIAKARYEISAARAFEDEAIVENTILSDAEAKAQTEALLIQDANMLPDLTEKGKPRATLRNVLHIIENAVDPECVAYDEFARRIIFMMDTPWGGCAGQAVTDISDSNLKIWIARNFRFEPSKDQCFEAMNILAHKNRFHPVRDYLDSLRWDGTERLGTWLKKGMGAVGHDEYLSAVGIKTLVAAVARIYEAGIKFDYVMVLEGDQGKKKSTAIAALAGADWFNDNLGDIHQKDVVDCMNGKWIIEISEMASARKADIDFLKGFITRQVDKVRLPYGRRAEEFPRQCIFIGTTNQEDYLHDETGNRRFWCVTIKEADVEWIRANRDQLFAEAVELYHLGEPLWLENKMIEAQAVKEQAARLHEDEWKPLIKNWLETQKDESGKLAKDYYTIIDIYKGAIGQTSISNNVTPLEGNRVRKVMRSLGWKTKVHRAGSNTYRVWVEKI